MTIKTFCDWCGKEIIESFPPQMHLSEPFVYLHFCSDKELKLYICKGRAKRK